MRSQLTVCITEGEEESREWAEVCQLVSHSAKLSTESSCIDSAPRAIDTERIDLQSSTLVQQMIINKGNCGIKARQDRLRDCWYFSLLLSSIIHSVATVGSF